MEQRFEDQITPSHRCKVCGALWRFWRKEESGPFAKGDSWNLRSSTCGKCCDMAPMGDQIEPMTVQHMAQWISAGLAVQAMTQHMLGPKADDEVH